MNIRFRESGKAVRPYKREKDTEIEDALLEVEEEKQEQQSLWDKILDSEYGDGDFVEDVA